MLRLTTCPRCLHHIPNDAQPGRHRGALSRVADAEICTACGSHEAELSLAGRELPSMAEWPIEAPWTTTSRLTSVHVAPLLGH
jgi:hypothetical protein